MNKRLGWAMVFAVAGITLALVGYFERKHTQSADIAAQIRELLVAPETEARRHRARKAISSDLEAFYEARAYAPAWSDRSHVKQLLRALHELRYDGLDPVDYAPAILRQVSTAPAPSGSAGRRAHAEFDLLATRAYLQALADLQQGKLRPPQRPRVSAVSNEGLAGHERLPPEPVQHLSIESAILAVDSNDIESAFARARPQLTVYASMREALRRLLAQAEQSSLAPVPDGPALRQGSSSPRVAILRQRLVADGYLDAVALGSENYDDELATAVKRFQADQFLPDDGVVNARTVAALNVPLRTRINQLRINLERARWQLRDLDSDFVLVDIAGYEVRYYHEGEPIWKSRIQVGKPMTPTPAFRSEISHITFNPMWRVPPGMMEREVLPSVRDDANYLANHRLRVLDSGGNEVDPRDVDWDDPYGITLQQDAGPGAALGRAAIRFPSPYIFLHETPHKKLFAKPQRSFSNGCVRVENLMWLVEKLLGKNATQMNALLADGRTRDVRLPRRVPILFVYWTVLPDQAGTIARRPDVYGLDPPTLQAMKLDRPQLASRL